MILNRTLNLFIFNIISISIIKFIGIFFYIEKSIIFAIIIALIIFSIIIYIYKTYKSAKLEYKTKRINVVVLSVISLCAIGNYLFHDYAFNGNDYTIAATMGKHYSEENSIYIDDPYIKDNFSGFYDTKKGILAQFLPLYPAYLSFFYDIGGVEGLFVANAILFFAILLSIFLIIIFFSNNILISLFGVIFISTNFLYIYFFQKTVFEIFLMFLFLSGTYFITRFYSTKKILYSYLVTLLFSLGLFTKLEIIPFIFISFIVIKYLYESFNISAKKILSNIGVCSLISLLFIFFVSYTSHPYVLHNMQYIYSILGNLFNFILFIIIGICAIYFVKIKTILKFIAKFWDSLVSKNNLIIIIVCLLLFIGLYLIEGNGILTRSQFAPIFILNMFKNYGIFLLLIFLPIFFLRERNEKIIIIVLLYIFGLYFIRDPGIGWSQPWAMRRFLVFTIPLLLFISLFVISNIKNIYIKYAIVSLLLINNFLPSMHIAFTNEMKKDYVSAKELSAKIGSGLVVLDNGRSWQKRIGYYLHFFMDEKIQIVQKKNLSQYVYSGKITYITTTNLLGHVDQYIYKINKLIMPCNITGYIDKSGNGINVNYIKEICFHIPINGYYFVDSMIHLYIIK